MGLWDWICGRKKITTIDPVFGTMTHEQGGQWFAEVLFPPTGTSLAIGVVVGEEGPDDPEREIFLQLIEYYQDCKEEWIGDIIGEIPELEVADNKQDLFRLRDMPEGSEMLLSVPVYIEINLNRSRRKPELWISYNVFFWHEASQEPEIPELGVVLVGIRNLEVVCVKKEE